LSFADVVWRANLSVFAGSGSKVGIHIESAWIILAPV
jgi:hypothetical protein